MSEELRNRLKSARETLGLSQSQAADAWGVPLKTLQAWEANRHTPRGLALTLLMEKLDAILEKPPAKKAVRKKR